MYIGCFINIINLNIVFEKYRKVNERIWKKVCFMLFVIYLGVNLFCKLKVKKFVNWKFKNV